MTEETHSWSFTSPEINISKSKSPSSFLASESFALSIGKILMHWSSYDDSFSGFFLCLVKYTNDPVKRPDRLKYHDKDVETRRIINQYATSNPILYQQIIRMLDIAIDLQLRRNVIAHGRLTWTGKHDGTVMHPSMVAKGELKGQPVEHEYTEDELDTLTYEYAHVDALASAFNRATGDHWISSAIPQQEIGLLTAINAAK
ncbi:hypothetical protein ACU4GR_30080 [Methylobacterium oryzae CBMB20]